MASWLSQTLKHLSARVLSDELGVSRSTIYRAKHGEISAATQSKINQGLKDIRGGTLIQTAYIQGKRLTARDVEVKPTPAQQRRISEAEKKEAARFEERRQVLHEQALEAKREVKGLSVKAIEGSLDLDRTTRETLGKALKDYQEAKSAAKKEWSKRLRTESFDEYLKRKTDKQYKALSEAFKDRREAEKNKVFKRLMTRHVIDKSIESYGRGKGHWYRIK